MKFNKSFIHTSIGNKRAIFYDLSIVDFIEIGIDNIH